MGGQRTKTARLVFLNRSTKSSRKPRRIEPRKRQMRRKRSLLPRDATLFHSVFDFCRQEFQIRRGLDPCPEDARMLFVREKTESTKIERNQLLRTYPGQSVSNGAGFCFRHFTDEFQRHMEILFAHPANCR